MIGAAVLTAHPTQGMAWTKERRNLSREYQEHLLFPGADDPERELVPTTRVLDATFLAVASAFGLSIEASDTHSFGHSGRVAHYAADIARTLGLSGLELDTVRMGAYLHDVGKVRVPQEILAKPGRLTPEEFEVVKMHPVWGVELLEGVDLPVDVRSTVLWHHEKCDGSGYPDRLRGREVPLHASIIAIADVFDALTSARSYRRAMSGRDALLEMHARRDWWLPEVYHAFLRSAAQPAYRAPSAARPTRWRTRLGRPVAA